MPTVELQTEQDWVVERTLVKRGASIGSGSAILSKITIGEHAIVGAGSVVTKDVPAYAIVAGNPAKVLRYQKAGYHKMNTSIPLLDLVTPHVELESELMEVVRTALRSAAFIGGKSLRTFEATFASFTGAAECVGVASGTDALRFALIAGGVKPGDTVLTVANTFIATAEAITQAGAFPEFIEVDELTHNMSPAKLRDHLEVCARDADSGLTSGPPDRYAHFRRASRSSVWPDGRHGRDCRDRAGVSSVAV